jgi:NAD dependent epimerase/dehydratase family enzyme
MHRPNLFTVPSFALKLLFGEGAQPILDSIRMKAGVLESIGFTYIYEDLEEALIDLV